MGICGEKSGVGRVERRPCRRPWLTQGDQQVLTRVGTAAEPPCSLRTALRAQILALPMFDIGPVTNLYALASLSVEWG